MRRRGQGLIAALLLASALSACTGQDQGPANRQSEELFGRSLNLEEARDSELGRCMSLPPERFVFESASLTERGGSDRLSVRFSDGEDYLNLSVMQMREEYSSRLADISQPAGYDLGLYDKPFEEAPNEYLQTLDAPIFALSDLNAEIIGTRELEKGSRHFRFGFLIDDLLIDISCRGLSAREIYEMLQNL